MKKKPHLGISISLINESTPRQCPKKNISPMGTTYRAEGLSIGRDYMRFEGSTRSTSLSPSALQIESVVGRGACSVVKRARQVSTKEPLALKIFPIRDAVRREMLVKELRALCRLECDCLVSLIGAFFDVKEGTVAMVLEYMDRGSLEDLLSIPRGKLSSVPCKKYCFPEAAISSLAYQMLWGLSYLHFEKICHRDIKPANVLVNSAGQVKLSDFGIASQHEEDQEMNVTVIGTTKYMSPERLRAKPYGVSSDIWSLGLVLLECAEKGSPFEGIHSVVELVQTIEESSMDDMIPSTVSQGLSEILRACLQKVPEKRVPANILISSPWFASHNIRNLNDAVCTMRQFIESTYAPQMANLLSLSAIGAMKNSEKGMGIYEGLL